MTKEYRESESFYLANASQLSKDIGFDRLQIQIVLDEFYPWELVWFEIEYYWCLAVQNSWWILLALGLLVFGGAITAQNYRKQHLKQCATPQTAVVLNREVGVSENETTNSTSSGSNNLLQKVGEGNSRSENSILAEQAFFEYSKPSKGNSELNSGSNNLINSTVTSDFQVDSINYQNSEKLTSTKDKNILSVGGFIETTNVIQIPETNFDFAEIREVLNQILTLDLTDINGIQTVNQQFVTIGRDYLHRLADSLKEGFKLMYPGIRGLSFTNYNNVDVDPEVFSGLSVRTRRGEEHHVTKEQLSMVAGLSGRNPAPILEAIEAVQQSRTVLDQIDRSMRQAREQLANYQQGINTVRARIDHLPDRVLVAPQQVVLVPSMNKGKSVQFYSRSFPFVDRLALGYYMSSHEISAGFGKATIKPIYKNIGVVTAFDISARFSNYPNFQYSGFGMKAFVGVGIAV